MQPYDAFNDFYGNNLSVLSGIPETLGTPQAEVSAPNQPKQNILESLLGGVTGMLGGGGGTMGGGL